MYYKASLDKPGIIITALIGLLLLSIAISMPLVEIHNPFIQYFTAVLFPLVILLTWLYHPQGYDLTVNAVFIKRPVGKITVMKNEIQSVHVLEKEQIEGAQRTFGSGGFFGYFGKFSESKLGKMSWYVTNRNNLVLVRLKGGRTFLLSPDDRNAFIKELGK